MLQFVHHVHYVVEDRDAMVAYLEKSFGIKPTLLREGRKEGKVAHFEIGQTQMQITSPLDPESGIGKYLTKHGPGVFHVAWGIGDANKAAQSLASQGNKLKGYDQGTMNTNKDGDLVFSINPASSQGIVFQLVEGQKARS